MKVPVYQTNADGSVLIDPNTKIGVPKYLPPVPGVINAQPVAEMRDETPAEIMDRLRTKNTADAQSSDPIIAGIARENLDWLDLIVGMSGSGSGTDPRVDDLVNQVADNTDDIDKINTELAEIAKQ